MNSKIIITLFGWLILFSLSVSAQEKESMESIWVFPDSIGIDFRGDEPKVFDVITPDRIDVFQRRNLAASSLLLKNDRILYAQIIDENIYYPPIDSNLGYNMRFIGCNIRNEKNQIIPNGDSIIMGRDKSCCLFLPLNDSLVYFFTVGNKKALRFIWEDIEDGIPNMKLALGLNPRLFYHKIEFISGLWIVTEKNIQISDTDVRSAIAAVKHHNGKDWWVYAHERNNSSGFITYKVMETGIEKHFTQFIGKVHYPILRDSNIVEKVSYSTIFDLEFASSMIVSKDGSKLAVISSVKDSSCRFDLQDAQVPIFDIFDVNRCNGKLSNWKDLAKVIPQHILETHGIWANCCISPTNKFIYFNCDKGTGPMVLYRTSPVFFRFDLTNNKFDLYRTNIKDDINLSFYPGFSLLGIDNKIYWNVFVRLCKPYLGVLNFPEEQNLDSCGFDPQGLFLTDSKCPNFGLPNNPHYDLGPVPPLPLQKKPVAYRDTICPQDTARLGGYFPAGLFVHQWSPMLGLSFVEGDSGTVLFQSPYIPKQDTLYTYVMTTSGRPNSCHEGEMTTDTFRILVHGRNHRPCFVSVPEPEAPPSPKILVYPNPTNGTLYLKSEGIKMLRFMLYNPNGQIAFEQNLSASEATLFVGDLADGTYLCKITTTEGIFTQKVVLIH